VILARPLLAILCCLVLPGCYVKTYGYQSAGRESATVTSTQGSATAKFSSGTGARASFSSGQTVSPGARGGQVALSRGGAVIVAVGLVLAETVHYLGVLFNPGPQPAPQADSIADTCSCYQKPVMGVE